MITYIIYNFRYVLRLAAHTNGIIVTNDNYRDLWLERDEWREISFGNWIKQSRDANELGRAGTTAGMLDHPSRYR